MKPYLPLEWTPKGMLERVNAFTEYYVSIVSSMIIFYYFTHFIALIILKPYHCPFLVRSVIIICHYVLNTL